MKQDEFVIFAELDREKFEEILERLMNQFQQIQFGRQGDDWIWAHFPDGIIEIDSFYSNNLEVKGRASQYASAADILGKLDPDMILDIYDPPKADLTR